MRSVALLISMSLLLHSCWSAADDVSGIWRTGDDSEKVVLDLFDPPLEGRVKLAVDQFGEDVAGVILIYADDYLHDLRHCLYVEDGAVKQGRFLFSATTADGAPLEGSLEVLDEHSPARLEGELYISEEGGASVHLVLEFSDDEKELKVEGWDYGCPSD